MLDFLLFSLSFSTGLLFLVLRSIFSYLKWGGSQTPHNRGFLYYTNQRGWERKREKRERERPNEGRTHSRGGKERERKKERKNTGLYQETVVEQPTHELEVCCGGTRPAILSTKHHHHCQWIVDSFRLWMHSKPIEVHHNFFFPIQTVLISIRFNIFI